LNDCTARIPLATLPQMQLHVPHQPPLRPGVTVDVAFGRLDGTMARRTAALASDQATGQPPEPTSNRRSSRPAVARTRRPEAQLLIGEPARPGHHTEWAQAGMEKRSQTIEITTQKIEERHLYQRMYQHFDPPIPVEGRGGGHPTAPDCSIAMTFKTVSRSSGRSSPPLPAFRLMPLMISVWRWAATAP